MKLSSRFAALLAVLVVAMATIALTGIRALQRLDSSLQSVVKEDMARLLTITNVRREVRGMVVLERDHILEHDKDAMRDASVRIMAKRARAKSELDAFAALAPKAEQDDVDVLRRTIERWEALDDRVIALSTDQQKDAAFALAQTHASDPVPWEKLIGKLVSANEARLAAQVSATTQAYRFARNLLIIVSSVAVAFALFVGTLVFRGIKRNMDEVVAINENLEGLVSDRTRELDGEKRAMELVLDSTGEGLLTVLLDGRLTGHRSRVVGTWFGVAAEETPVWTYLWPETDAVGLESFALAFAQLAEDVLPFEVSAASMPQSLDRDGRRYELDYRQILENGVFSRILIIVRDVSARLAGEEAERLAHEEQAVVRHLLRDRKGFSQCVSDCEHLIAEIAEATDLTILKMDLHTLNGNAGAYGFQSVAARCRLLEDAIAEGQRLLTGQETADLMALWRTRLGSVQEFFSADTHDIVEISETEHQRLLDDLRSRRDYEEILAFAETWRWGRTVEVLTRLRVQADHIANRIGKRLAVSIEPNGLRMQPGILEDFWPTLVHVLRNAIDHGIEDAETRAAREKPAEGQIRLVSRLEGETFVIAITDDGAGIDFDAVGAAARRRGLTVASHADAIAALFADGVSTRTSITALSGRGVGMGATRRACEAKRGRISIHTELGRGTTFEFRFPLSVVPAMRMATEPPCSMAKPRHDAQANRFLIAG